MRKNFFLVHFLIVQNFETKNYKEGKKRVHNVCILLNIIEAGRQAQGQFSPAVKWERE